MTHDLTRTLEARADRADTDPDTDLWLREIDLRHTRRVRRRRVTLAAGISSLAVAAVAVPLVTVLGGDDATPSAAHRDGTTIGSGWGGDLGTPFGNAGHAGRGPVSTPVHRQLVAAPAAPKDAPATLALVPAGFDRVGVIPSATSYGPASAGDDASGFVGKVTVLIGERYDHRTSGTRIAGYPAVIEPARPGDPGWFVRFYYSRTIEIDIQIPPAAGLDRAQVLRMAGTLKVHDVSNPGVG